MTVRTDRLRLDRPSPGDVDALFALYADPRVWAADPVSRHHRREDTVAMVERWDTGWRRNGLGMWVARPLDDEQLLGIGGCFQHPDVAWSVGFRLRPEVWGHGFAAEIGRAGMAAATVARPDLPVTATVVATNDRSARSVTRLGLHPVWHGPDAGNPDPDVLRVLFADRELDPAVVAALTRH